MSVDDEQEFRARFRGVTDKITDAEAIADAADQVLLVTAEAGISRDELRALHRVITWTLPHTQVIVMNGMTLAQPMSRLHAQQLLQSLLADLPEDR